MGNKRILITSLIVDLAVICLASFSGYKIANTADDCR